MTFKPNKRLNYDFMNIKLFPLAEPSVLLQQTVGENEKGLLVVIFEEETRTELVPFLTKILGAVQYDLARDAQTIKITNKTVFSLMNLCNHLDKEVNQVLFFGQSPKQVGLNLNVQKYQSVVIGGKKILFADDLAVIHDDTELKKALWGSLQAMFLK